MQEIRDSYTVLPLREKRRLQKAATKRSRGGARIDLDTPSAAHWKLQGQTAPLGHRQHGLELRSWFDAGFRRSRRRAAAQGGQFGFGLAWQELSPATEIFSVSFFAKAAMARTAAQPQATKIVQKSQKQQQKQESNPLAKKLTAKARAKVNRSSGRKGRLQGQRPGTRQS